MCWARQVRGSARARPAGSKGSARRHGGAHRATGAERSRHRRDVSEDRRRASRARHRSDGGAPTQAHRPQAPARPDASLRLRPSRCTTGSPSLSLPSHTRGREARRRRTVAGGNVFVNKLTKPPFAHQIPGRTGADVCSPAIRRKALGNISHRGSAARPPAAPDGRAGCRSWPGGGGRARPRRRRCRSRGRGRTTRTSRCPRR